MDWKAVLMVHLGSSLYSLQIRSTSYKILSILCPQTVPNVILSNDFCVFLRMLTRLSKIVFKTTRMASKQLLNVIMTPNIPIRVLCLFLNDQKWIFALKNIQIEVWGKFIGHCDVILSAILQFPVRAIEKKAQNWTSRQSAMKKVPKTSEKKSQYYLYVWSTIPSVWS